MILLSQIDKNQESCYIQNKLLINKLSKSGVEHTCNFQHDRFIAPTTSLLIFLSRSFNSHDKHSDYYSNIFVINFFLRYQNILVQPRYK